MQQHGIRSVGGCTGWCHPWQGSTVVRTITTCNAKTLRHMLV
jgi:hypothetical protein